jgi:flagellar motor switch protein FliG
VSAAIEERNRLAEPSAGRAVAARGGGNGLRGSQKAAVLLVALGEERAGEVLRHLPAEEIEKLSLEIAKATHVPAEISKSVLLEAAETVAATDHIANGGVDYARAVLERSLGAEQADMIMSRLTATIERRPFEFLRNTPPEQISVFLRQESPQTIALVIANLNTNLAAQVLCLLPPENQAGVAWRIATMNETRPEILQRIESVMRQKLSAVESSEYAVAGGVKSLAEILNHSDRPTERNVLDQLAEEDEPLAEEIRMLLFTFEDVAGLDDRAIQLILKDVDQDDLAIALRGVSEELRERMYSNMSTRGAELLREDIEFKPPQRRRIVEEAQSRIVAIVRRLEEQGVVTIARATGSGDDELM